MMMSYFKEGIPRDITLEKIYVVRDDNGFVIGYGGSIATAIMDADNLEYEEARSIEKYLIEEIRERRY